MPHEAGGTLRIGRVAIDARHRGRGLGRLMVSEARRRAREDQPDAAIALAAQTHLRRFYETFGFITDGAPYWDGGIAHVEMRRAPGRADIAATPA